MPDLWGDAYLLLRVTDAGEGMDEENRASMFRPFLPPDRAKAGA